MTLPGGVSVYVSPDLLCPLHPRPAQQGPGLALWLLHQVLVSTSISLHTLQHCSAGDVPDNPDPGVPELLPEVAVLLVRGGQVPAVDTHVTAVPLLAPSHAFSVKGLTLEL